MRGPHKRFLAILFFLRSSKMNRPKTTFDFIHLFAMVLSLFLSACSQTSPVPNHHTQKSLTLLPPKKAPLLQYLSHTDRKLGNHSAFYSLADPNDALAARIFLIDHATASLDVQYYIYEDDKTGNFFSYHLLKAAQRGVKVRILLDDLITSGKDKKLAILASHPNIELRLFNPNHLRRSLRNMALLFDIDHLGKRMHNKALIADGSAAIIGGRNIGDVYYAANSKTLFLDYDILAIGKVVPDIYRSFDLYWNSKEAVPSNDILADNLNTKKYYHVEKQHTEAVKEFLHSPAGKAMSHSRFLNDISEKRVRMVVSGRTDFYYDYPEKVNTDTNDNRTHISAQVSEDLKHVTHDLIIVSPYFIPGQEMMEKLHSLRKKNIKVTIVTNSLASTDVFPVYSGYKWYIKDLLQMGIELYELKPQSLNLYFKKNKIDKHLHTSLHTKMMLLDSNRLVVGSANVDPRSDKLNTETLMIISSKKLAKVQRSKFMKILTEEYFYRLSWEKYPLDANDDGMAEYGPVWHTLQKGKEKVYYMPPHAGFFKTLGTDILSFLPIEGYL